MPSDYRSQIARAVYPEERELLQPVAAVLKVVIHRGIQTHLRRAVILPPEQGNV